MVLWKRGLKRFSNLSCSWFPRRDYKCRGLISNAGRLDVTLLFTRIYDASCTWRAPSWLRHLRCLEAISRSKMTSVPSLMASKAVSCLLGLQEDEGLLACSCVQVRKALSIVTRITSETDRGLLICRGWRTGIDCIHNRTDLHTYIPYAGCVVRRCTTTCNVSKILNR